MFYLLAERLNDPDEVVRILAEHQHEGDLHDIQNMYDSICLTKSHVGLTFNSLLNFSKTRFTLTNLWPRKKLISF